MGGLLLGGNVHTNGGAHLGRKAVKGRHLKFNLQNVLPLAFFFVQVGILYGNYLLKGGRGEGRGGEAYA